MAAPMPLPAPVTTAWQPANGLAASLVAVACVCCTETASVRGYFKSKIF